MVDMLDQDGVQDLIGGMTGQPRRRSGIGGAAGAAFARPSQLPPPGQLATATNAVQRFQNSPTSRDQGLMGAAGKLAQGLQGGTATGPRVTPLDGGGTMTTNDPSVTIGPNDAGLAPTPAAPDYKTRGKYATFNAGAADKYDRPWDQLSERYKMQTVLSNFDPSQGITPEVLAALNAADINGARFSGSRDKLDARNLSQWENYNGVEGIGDIIQGFNDPNNANKTWGAWAPEEGDAVLPGGGAPGATGAGPFGFMDPSLSGDPMAGIQQALAAVQRPGTIQELIAKLQGGGA